MGKILITGASGFIGSHLVSQLLKDGVPLKNLRLFILPGESLENLPKKDFDILWGDIRDKAAVKKAVKDVDVIYHLAARIGFDGKTHDDYFEINVDGTQNLLDAVKKNNIKKFVSFSSVAVLGLPAYVGDMKKLNENSKENYGDFYGESKWEGEKVVKKAYEKYGIPYSIIRPTSVYGPGDKKNILPLYKAVKKGYFFFIGNGKNKLDYIYVDDLVKGVIQAQKSKLKEGTYIMGVENAPTLNEVVKNVAESIGKKPTKMRVPKICGYTIAYITDFTNRLFGTRLPFYPGRVRAMTSNFYFDVSRAKKEIRYKSNISFKKGTQLTAAWLKDEGIL